MQLIAWAYDTRDGFTLRGWHTPPSGKPLIHFIHGNGFCARAYEPMLRALSKHFDLWLSDVQGHGDSDPGERFVGWNRCADLAVEAFKHHQHDLFGAVPCFGLGQASAVYSPAWPWPSTLVCSSAPCCSIPYCSRP